MSKALIASFAGVVLLVCAGYVLAEDAPAPATKPAGDSTTQSSAQDEQFVKDTLAKIKPFDQASADEAENALVELGKKNPEVIMTAIRSAAKEGKDEQLTPLLDAFIRTRYAVDPKKEILEYIKKQPGWEKEDVEGRIRPQAILDDSMGQAIHLNDVFFLVRFRMYPVAHLVKPPLQATNIFVLKPRRGEATKVTLIVDADGLKKYLSHIGNSVAKVDDAKRFLKAWLRLSQEFANDGMMHFTIDDDAVTAEKKDDGTIVATGKATVDRGGKGELEATLTFKVGVLSDVKETKNIKAGMRPKCQAKKLLDKDDVVRYMARQSLLIMGTDAHDYMFEVRATASPELQKAIDEVWQEILRDEQRFGKK